MKKTINIILLFALTLLLSCSSTAQDNESSNSETNMTLLIDCTSASLYDDIEHDIRINIPNYLQTTGVTNINYLQKFCMRVGFIEASGDLSLTQESISLPEKKKVSNNRDNLVEIMIFQGQTDFISKVSGILQHFLEKMSRCP